MIVEVDHRGWFADGKLFVQKMLEADIEVFTREGDAIVPVTTAEGVARGTPLLVRLDTALEVLSIAKHFDVMIRDRQDGAWIYLDAKGGRFSQR